MLPVGANAASGWPPILYADWNASEESVLELFRADREQACLSFPAFQKHARSNRIFEKEEPRTLMRTTVSFESDA
jgi:hypothetical protein